MRLISFSLAANSAPRIGVLLGPEGDERIVDLVRAPSPTPIIEAAQGDMVRFLAAGDAAMDEARRAVAVLRDACLDGSRSWRPASEAVPATQAVLIEPARVHYLPVVVRPGKAVCVGLNFQSHIDEARAAGQPMPESVTEPLGFSKVGSALAGHLQPIVLPRFGRQLDYEVELAFIIGRRCRNAAISDFDRYVAGCTIAVDLSLRDLLFRSAGNPFQAKNFDGFCPLGPALVSLDELGDPDDRVLRLWVNGELRQQESMRHALFKCAEILAYWSQRFTFEPGDVLTCGTPAGVGIFSADPERWLLKPGDVIQASIDGLGTLTNRIIAPAEAGAMLQNNQDHS